MFLPDLLSRRNRHPFSLVPRQSIAARTLSFLVAIMTFLSCLTFGAVYLVQNSAMAWSSEVGREVTIQLQPRTDEQMLSDLRVAITLSRQFPGVADAFELTIEDSRQLLEPWLGENFDVADFYLPRLIIVRIADPLGFDPDALYRLLADNIDNVAIDTHTIWQKQLNTMAGTVVFSGSLALLLILSATVLAIVFATGGAVATNRGVVEVMHFIGASDNYIAKAFQNRFLAIGLQGGTGGGAAAIVFFLVANAVVRAFLPQQSADQISVLFGHFDPGWAGLSGLVVIVVIVAVLTAITSRVTVHRFLSQIAP